MELKKLLLIASLLLSGAALQAQSIKLNLSNMQVNVVSAKYTVDPIVVNLQINHTTDEIKLFSNNDAEVYASYTLDSYTGVSRSNTKKSSIKIKVKYQFLYHGKRVKRVVERYYYLEDDRSFTENEKAIFTEGISNKVVSISYLAVLQE